MDYSKLNFKDKETLRLVRNIMQDEINHAESGNFSPSYLEMLREYTLNEYFAAHPAAKVAHTENLKQAWRKS